MVFAAGKQVVDLLTNGTSIFLMKLSMFGGRGTSISVISPWN